jgi:NTE family protein
VKMNAVFEGGGVKAIALVGAVKAAEERNLRFDKLAGTSSGALVASLIAAGYSADEMKNMILETPFTDFLQDSWYHRLNVVGRGMRILIKKGLYSGDILENWIRHKLLLKGVRTFGDLEPNKLRIIASDITRSKLLVLPNDIADYGTDPLKLEIAQAVRMSTSIPYFFDPVILKKTMKYKYPIFIVDGALLSNFPLWIFDLAYNASNNKKMTPTVGFQLVGKNMNTPNNIRGPLSMFQGLFQTMLDAHDERYIEKQNSFRTIKIPTLGVQTTQFDIPKQKSLDLHHSGLTAGIDFFDKWSFSKYMEQFNEYVV